MFFTKSAKCRQCIVYKFPSFKHSPQRKKVNDKNAMLCPAL